MESAGQAECHSNLASCEGLQLSRWANIGSENSDAFHKYLLILLHTRPCAGDRAVQEAGSLPSQGPPPSLTYTLRAATP